MHYGQIKGQKSQEEKGRTVMARHGENIRKRKDGRWEGRYPVYDETRGKQVYHSIYGRTYSEVREKLTTKKNLLKNPASTITTEDRPCIIFTNAAKEWLAKVKMERKTSTYVKYSLIYQKYIEEVFDSMAVSELTDSYVKEKLDSTLSYSVYKSIYCVLNQILKFVSAQYSVTIVPLKKPDLKKSNKPVNVLSKSEQKKLITVLYQQMDLYKMAVLLGMFTGLRLGELCGLKWSDIDFDNKILTVNRTVQRLYVEGCETKTILMEMPPKSMHSKREIPLSASAADLLMKFENGKQYIFGGDKPLEPRTLQYHFKKLLKEAKLPDTNFHILRHTFSTNCIEGGTDVKSLSEILGHSDVQITLNRYVHPSLDTKRRYMDHLSAFYGQIYGQAG